jgi:hypothetical protein
MTILKEFKHLVNKDELGRRVKDVILKAFDTSEEDFSEDDILIPLDTVMSRIEVPEFSINANQYIDRVRSEFQSGAAQNEEIHRLSALQSEMLIAASEYTIKTLRDCSGKIAKVLNDQAISFADEISKKISKDGDSLQKQMKEKEHYIHLYEEFLKDVKEKKGVI